MVFEALHNLEPRGYVVGWIIAISLLVGILIFLLLAVLLWKVSVAIVGRRGAPTHGCLALGRTRGGALRRSFLLGLPSPCRHSGGRAVSLQARMESCLLLRPFTAEGWTFRGRANISAPLCSNLLSGLHGKAGA